MSFHTYVYYTATVALFLIPNRNVHTLHIVKGMDVSSLFFFNFRTLARVEKSHVYENEVAAQWNESNKMEYASSSSQQLSQQSGSQSRADADANAAQTASATGVKQAGVTQPVDYPVSQHSESTSHTEYVNVQRQIPAARSPHDIILNDAANNIGNNNAYEALNAEDIQRHSGDGDQLQYDSLQLQ